MQWIKINSEKDLPKADWEGIAVIDGDPKKSNWSLLKWQLDTYPLTPFKYLDESPSHTTDLSKVFDENADVCSDPPFFEKAAMSKSRFIPTVEKYCAGKTVDVKGIIDFVKAEQTKSQNMYQSYRSNCFTQDAANNCSGENLAFAIVLEYLEKLPKTTAPQTDASGLIDKWKLILSRGDIESVPVAINQFIHDLKNQSIK